MPPSATPTKPRLVERRVRSVTIDYFTVERRPTGERVEMLRQAGRGEIVRLSVGEAARLDSQGALCPPGQTMAELEQELDDRYTAYATARRSTSSATEGSAT